MTFEWFEQAYDFVMSIIVKIKMSSIHQRIAARLKSVKEWLKIRLYNPRLYLISLLKILRKFR